MGTTRNNMRTAIAKAYDLIYIVFYYYLYRGVNDWVILCERSDLNTATVFAKPLLRRRNFVL